MKSLQKARARVRGIRERHGERLMGFVGVLVLLSLVFIG